MELLIPGVVWVTSGIATAFWLRRRGHVFVSWSALGFVFGSRVLGLALSVHVSPDDVGKVASTA
jgi:hypothetical protein